MRALGYSFAGDWDWCDARRGDEDAVFERCVECDGGGPEVADLGARFGPGSVSVFLDVDGDGGVGCELVDGVVGGAWSPGPGGLWGSGERAGGGRARIEAEPGTPRNVKIQAGRSTLPRSVAKPAWSSWMLVMVSGVGLGSGPGEPDARNAASASAAVMIG